MAWSAMYHRTITMLYLVLTLNNSLMWEEEFRVQSTIKNKYNNKLAILSLMGLVHNRIREEISNKTQHHMLRLCIIQKQTIISLIQTCNNKLNKRAKLQITSMELPTTFIVINNLKEIELASIAICLLSPNKNKIKAPWQMQAASKYLGQLFNNKIELMVLLTQIRDHQQLIESLEE